MGKLADLFVKLGLKSSEFNKGIDSAQKKTNMFGSGLKKIGGLVAGAFAVGQIVSFGKELIELSGVAEGVRSAFERIAPAGTMQDLQKATAGTVGELELMKRAVSAKNLGLPVENLASLFEFATKRAQETGESVDYLVNSIVTGIGRKSPLILDNLGISAIELRKKLKGVGMETASVADVAAAVGRIAADSMRESGDIIDSNAIKIENIKTQWQDFKLELAENEGFKKAVSSTLSEWQEFMYVVFSDIATAGEKWKIAFAGDDKATEIYLEVKLRTEQAEKKVKEFNETTLKELEKILDSEETKRLAALEIGDHVQVKKSDAAIKDLTERINKLKQSVDELDNVEKSNIVTIKSLKEEIKTLQETRELADTADQKYIDTLNEQISVKEELIKKILGTTESFKGETEAAKRLAAVIENLNNSLTDLHDSGVFSFEQFIDKSMGSKFESELSKKLSEMSLDEITQEVFIKFKLDTEQTEGLGFDTEAQFTKIQQMQDFVDELNFIAQQGMTELITTFAEGFGRLIAGDIGLEEFFKSILDTVGRFLIQFGQALVAYGVSQLAFKIPNPASKIAAGAALIAIGGAISSMAASGPSFGGGASSGVAALPSTNFGIFTTDFMGSREQNQLSTKIRGNELILVTDREQRRNATIG